jgi:hypothetical protein
MQKNEVDSKAFMRTDTSRDKKILFSLMLGFFLLFGACSPLLKPGEAGDKCELMSPGTSILSHRGYIYRFGGKNSEGEYSDTVGAASLSDDGTFSEWAAQTPLPGARAFQSVVAYGEYLYLIGGRNESGYLDDVWFAYVHPDGSLKSSWMRSKYSLSDGRAGAAAFIIDGRIYMAGGEGSEGLSDEVLSARIWSDGKPGLWAPASMKLPSPRSGAAALRVGSKIYLAGGKSSDDYLSDFLISELAVDGTLGAWTVGPSLPEARSFAALVPDGDAVGLIGGEAAAGATTASYSLGPDSTWERKPAFDGPWSGQGAVMRGWVCLPQSISSVKVSDEAIVSLLALSGASSGSPTAKPSGGLVKKDSTVALFAAADETVRYSIATGGAEPPDPNENSTLYSSDSRPKISADTVLKVRSFKTGMEASSIARLAFRVESTSLFYTIEKTLRPTSSYMLCTLQETYSGGSTALTSLVWYELSIVDKGWYSISVRDKDDDPISYIDSVHASLFEGSPLSLLQDSSQTDIYKRQDDIVVYLVPGTYMLRIASMSGAKGGNFGLRFSRNL